MAIALNLIIAMSFGTFMMVGQTTNRPEVIAEGEWSVPVADPRGFALRGRFVLCEKFVAEDRREVAVYVELQDACDFISSGGMQLFCEMGKTDFRPECKGGLHCEMRDVDNRLIDPEGFPFSGAVPLSEWVRLPTDATIRLRATPFGIHRANARAISSNTNTLWVINDGDPKEYLLTGTFTIDPAADQVVTGEGHVWRGAIELPPVKLVGRRK